ncbi:MAG: DUF202 domain-containing protein, partial [Nanoarchaeota archaeon]
MKTSDKSSVERTFLSKERNALSEERTVLSYIRTELAFVGIVILILRFYFTEASWSIPLAFILMVLFAIILIAETVKIKKLKRKR